MTDYALITDSNDRHRTFVIVVAVLLVAVGAFQALATGGRLLITPWTMGEYVAAPYILHEIGSLAFMVAAVVIGFRLLNQHRSALREAIVLLWAYMLWIGISVVVGLGAFLWSAVMMNSLDMEPLESVFDSGLAYTLFGTVSGIAYCVVLGWIAKRLSRPVVKHAYQQ
ncbi:MAG: hypothetical protein AAF351_01355 [Pseudomonadota bacterium]